MNSKILVLASVASMIDQFNIPNIKLLIEMGYKVHVACNFEEGNTCSYEQIENLKAKLLELNVIYHQIDFKRNVIKLSDNIKAYKQVRNLMRSNKYKFVHCHSPIGGVCGRLAGKATDTKIIYTAHGFHFYKGAPLKNWMVFYPIEKWLSKYTDVLVAINKEDYKRAKKYFESKRIKYIPGVGIDTSKFINIDIDKEEKRKSMGIKDGDFMILSVGELNKNKNHHVIIKAISKLENNKIKYVLCGQGPIEDELKLLVKKLDLENQVIFIGFRNDIPEILSVSDLFVFPSFREGLPLSLMEAMSSGLPVICSNIRGNIDLIENKKGGFLVNPTNVNDISKKINILVNDKVLRSQYGDFNRDIINKFSIDNVIDGMKKIYQEV